jgi:hypothetical protein
MLLIRLYQNLHKATYIKEWCIECLQKHLHEAEAVTENEAVSMRVHTSLLCSQSLKTVKTQQLVLNIMQYKSLKVLL